MRLEWDEMCMTYRTPRISYLRRPYLPCGDTHLLMLPQLYRIDDLIVVWADVAYHLLVLRILPKKPFHLSCNNEKDTFLTFNRLFTRFGGATLPNFESKLSTNFRTDGITKLYISLSGDGEYRGIRLQRNGLCKSWKVNISGMCDVVCVNMRMGKREKHHLHTCTHTLILMVSFFTFIPNLNRCLERVRWWLDFVERFSGFLVNFRKVL